MSASISNSTDTSNVNTINNVSFNDATPLDQTNPLNSNNSTTNPFDSLNLPTKNIFASSFACYTLIVGGTTFQLSEAALLSDSPNRFTDYFTKSLNPVMNIDRDPEIFKDIGYFVVARDEAHYMYLTIDAVYYRLKTLKDRLRMNYMINVGGKVFRLNRDLIETRDTPNFFTSIGFDYYWEPPSNTSFIPSLAPTTIDRDPDLFTEIVRYLRGYDVEIKSEVQRQNLLKESRFYRLKGLTEKLLASKLIVNGFDVRDDDNSDGGGELKNEILFHLKDIRASSSVILLENKIITNYDSSNHMMQDDNDDDVNNNRSITYHINDNNARNRIMYKNREGLLYYLLVQVHNTDLICRYDTLASPSNSGVETPLSPTGFKFSSSKTITPTLELQLSKDDVKKIKSIAKSIKVSEDIITMVWSSSLSSSCAFEIDGKSLTFDVLTNVDKLSSLIKTDQFGNKFLKLFIKRTILRLYVNKDQKIGIEMLKCEAFSTEREFNAKREFLD